MSPHGYYIVVTRFGIDLYEIHKFGKIYTKPTITSPGDILGVDKEEKKESLEIIKPYINSYTDPRVMNVVLIDHTVYYLLVHYKESLKIAPGAVKYRSATGVFEEDYISSATPYVEPEETTMERDTYPLSSITKETFNKEFPQGWSSGHTGYEIKRADGSFIRDWKETDS